MTREEAAGVIKFEKACVLRQDTPRCNRDCKKCDLLLPTEDVLTAYDMAIKALEQQPCEDVEEYGLNQQIEFPETFEGFAKEFGFKDDKEVYTNGSDLIPIFRVKQWLEQNMANESIKALDKLDSIIVEQLDKSTDFKECMTLRWVLDKIAEVEE